MSAPAEPKTFDLRMVGEGLRIAEVYGERLLVRLVKPHTIMNEYESKGLFIPETAKEKHEPIESCGIVIAIGRALEGAPNVPPLESMILFSKWAGTDYKIEGEKVRVLDLKEVMCRVESAEGKATFKIELNK